jgi:hypothetical protein
MFSRLSKTTEVHLLGRPNVKSTKDGDSLHTRPNISLLKEPKTTRLTKPTLAA